MKCSDAFSEYFKNIYGERWPSLLEALLREEKQVARRNTFAKHNSSQQKLEEVLWLPNCFWIGNDKFLPTRSENDLLDFYVQDPASVMVAQSLNVQDGDRVLDMCAAPGGKSLILIESLKRSGEIFCNDLSSERRERLKKVIQQYVSRDVRERVWVTGKDGAQFGLREPKSFDRVLLDAPCSGERHLLQSEKAMQEWSPRRAENLATRQYSLLSAAFLTAKVGARIVYSTCSMNPVENDKVVAKLFKKRGQSLSLLQSQYSMQGESTEYGVSFLPDKCGFGPMYCAIIEKSAE